MIMNDGLGFTKLHHPPRVSHPARVTRRLFSSSFRVNLGSSLLVVKQGLQYKLNVHLYLNVFYDEPNFTRTEPDFGAAAKLRRVW
jgi:hypothetical protein